MSLPGTFGPSAKLHLPGIEGNLPNVDQPTDPMLFKSSMVTHPDSVLPILGLQETRL